MRIAIETGIADYEATQRDQLVGDGDSDRTRRISAGAGGRDCVQLAGDRGVETEEGNVRRAGVGDRQEIFAGTVDRQGGRRRDIGIG